MILTLLFTMSGLIMGHLALNSFSKKEPSLEIYEQRFLDQIDSLRYPPLYDLVHIQYRDMSQICTNPIKAWWLGDKICEGAATLAGVCYGIPTPLGGLVRVAIDISPNYKAFPLVEEELIMHELAHCLYKVKHSSPNESGRSRIMEPTLNIFNDRKILDKEENLMLDYIRLNYQLLKEGNQP